MPCPKCQFDCPPDFSFCPRCGTALQRACPNCAFQVPLGFAFCPKCGTPLAAGAVSAPLPAQEPPEAATTEALKRLVPKEYAERLMASRGQSSGERRVVTILFSDVKGSTAMAERLDPEDVMDIMNGAFDVLIPPVYRYEGTLARLMGDAILAFFGAPIAQEDDPARAIRAGLEIVAGAKAYAARLEQEWGISGFNVRVGIHTGLVVMGEVGSDLRVEYTAMGDAINLAARMEQNAPVGGILISHDTYRQVQDLFDARILDPIPVKGRSKPVQVYLVERVRPRAFHQPACGIGGIQTRLVGREAELEQLQAALQEARAERVLHVVTISGEAGVGKSRLLYAFERGLEALPEPITCLRGRAGPELQGVPYALLRSLFNFSFDIKESDSAEVAREKFERGLIETWKSGQDMVIKSHFIGWLLGFDFASPYLQEVLQDPRQLRSRAMYYLAEFLQALASRATLLILLEDLHWADDSSLDAIDELVVRLGQWDVPLLLVGLARPVLQERRPQWGQGQVAHSWLDLQPLSRDDSRRLVVEILQGVEDVPASLRELVVKKAEGNPLYIEELIKMLIEDGVIVRGEAGWRIDVERLGEMHVPPTLTGVLQARLDSLPLPERTILQQAAVVGRTFWDRAVAHIGGLDSRAGGGKDLPTALEDLEHKEMIFGRPSSVLAGAAEFFFKHALLRDVAYGGILKKVRRAYHGLVAEWLIANSADREGEVLGLIAEHLDLAGQGGRALLYLRRAGEQAARQYANAEAARYFGRALALVPEADAATRYELLLARIKVLDFLGQRPAQERDLVELEELAAGMADPGQKAEAALQRSQYAEVIGGYPAAVAAAREAIRWAQAGQDLQREAEGYRRWGNVLYDQADYELARQRFERARDLFRETGDRRGEAAAINNVGNIVFDLGDNERGIACYEQALSLYRQVGDRRGEMGALNNRGLAALRQGDCIVAMSYLEQALDICRQVGDRRVEGNILGNLGMGCTELGDYAAARAYCEQELCIDRETGDRWGESISLLNLGEIACLVGEYEEARAYCQQVLPLSREIGVRNVEGSTLECLGHALVGLRQLDQAEATYQTSLEIWRELGEEAAEVEILAGLARVHLARGDLAAGLVQVEAILNRLQAGVLEGSDEPLWVYLSCYQVLHASADPRARTVLGTAYSMLQTKADRISDEKVRRSLLENVAINRQIVAAWEHVSAWVIE